MAGQLWVRVIRKNKIIESRTAPCTYETWQQALDDICHGLDISRPVILPRHERDWEQFGLTHFLPEHFLESVHFDKLPAGSLPAGFCVGRRRTGDGMDGTFLRQERNVPPLLLSLTRFAPLRRLYG